MSDGASVGPGSKASPGAASVSALSGYDPSRIARELSVSQKSALRAFCSRRNSPWGYFASDLGVSGKACASLEAKGLLLGGLFAGDRARAYRYTNNGHAVNVAVLRDSDGSGGAGETVGLDPTGDSAGRNAASPDHSIASQGKDRNGGEG